MTDPNILYIFKLSIVSKLNYHQHDLLKTTLQVFPSVIFLLFHFVEYICSFEASPMNIMIYGFYYIQHLLPASLSTILPCCEYMYTPLS